MTSQVRLDKAEVAGSSPASSIEESPAQAGFFARRVRNQRPHRRTESPDANKCQLVKPAAGDPTVSCVIPGDQRYRLNLFSLKAEELMRSRFAKALYNKRSGVKVSGSLLGPAKVEVNGPEDEAVRAFVPTLRMFIQKNDDISVPKVDLIYESQAVPEGLRAEFAEARKTLNDFLDEDTMFVFIDETITRDRLRDVLMNGDLSHVEAPKRAAFEQWQRYRCVRADEQRLHRDARNRL